MFLICFFRLLSDECLLFLCVFSLVVDFSMLIIEYDRTLFPPIRKNKPCLTAQTQIPKQDQL